MGFVNMGFGNLVNSDKVIAIVDPNTLPMKKLISKLDPEKMLNLPATSGRRSRAAVILDTGHVILSALQTETLALRIAREGGEAEPDEE